MLRDRKFALLFLLNWSLGLCFSYGHFGDMLADDVVLPADFEVLLSNGFDTGVVGHELMVAAI